MAICIQSIDEGSTAARLGLAPGDELLSVDGNPLNDTLDYDFYTDSDSFHLKARVADGIREWEVQREQRGPFGCGFSTYLGIKNTPAQTTVCFASLTSCPLVCGRAFILRTMMSGCPFCLATISR